MRTTEKSQNGNGAKARAKGYVTELRWELGSETQGREMDFSESQGLGLSHLCQDRV